MKRERLLGGRDHVHLLGEQTEKLSQHGSKLCVVIDDENAPAPLGDWLDKHPTEANSAAWGGRPQIAVRKWPIGAPLSSVRMSEVDRIAANGKRGSARQYRPPSARGPVFVPVRSALVVRQTKLETLAVVHALERGLEGAVDGGARRTLRRFAYSEPRLSGSVAGIRALGRRRFGELAALLRSTDDELRHAATFALGCIGEARAVAPLVALLVRQRDRFDHDFAYQACGRLGDVALAELGRFALRGKKSERREAVQALGQSRADALPVLRRVLRQGRLPPSFFVAYFNLHDARGLPDLMVGLRAKERATQRDALEAAEALLGDGARPRVDIRAWGNILARLAQGRDGEAASTALSCLGLLGDSRHVDILVEATRHPDDWRSYQAIRALGRLGGAVARARLEELLDEDGVAKSTAAAVCLVEDPRARALCPRAFAAMLRGVQELPDSFEAMDAAEALAGSKAGTDAAIEAAHQLRGRRRARILDALAYGFGFLRPSPRERAVARALAASERPVAAALLAACAKWEVRPA